MVHGVEFSFVFAVTFLGFGIDPPKRGNLGKNVTPLTVVSAISNGGGVAAEEMVH